MITIRILVLHRAGSNRSFVRKSNVNFVCSVFQHRTWLFSSASSPSGRGADQKCLGRFVWPWAKQITMAHDAYHCTDSDAGDTRPFPTRRWEGVGNFVGSSVAKNGSIGFTRQNECPVQCRPKTNKDWLFC